MTIGQRISHNAKAIAAIITALVTLVTTLLATVPADLLPATAAVWINTAVAFATSAVVWLTANGPKVGDAVDRFSGDVSPAVTEVKQGIDDLDDLLAAVREGKNIRIQTPVDE